MNEHNALKIYTFLQQCCKENWDLDEDDIKHILELDFDYIRKQYIIEELKEGIKISCPSCGTDNIDDMDVGTNEKSKVICKKCKIEVCEE